MRMVIRWPRQRQPCGPSAHNVRVARTRAGLSMEELSRRAQVSKGALVALENAQGNPNLATLVRLADTLGISVSDLMQGPSEGHVRIVAADAVTPLWTGELGSEARLMLTTTGPAPWKSGAGNWHRTRNTPATRTRPASWKPSTSRPAE